MYEENFPQFFFSAHWYSQLRVSFQTSWYLPVYPGWAAQWGGAAGPGRPAQPLLTRLAPLPLVSGPKRWTTDDYKTAYGFGLSLICKL